MSTLYDTPFLVLSAKAQRPADRPSSWESVLLVGSIALMAVMLAAFAMSRFSSAGLWHPITIASGMACMLMATLLAGASAISGAAQFAGLIGNPERFLLTELHGHFSRERNDVAELAARFDQEQLEYAQERLQLAVAQLRHRTSLTIGAVEKLGVVPGAVLGGYYLLQLVRSEDLRGDYIPAVFVSAAVIYVLGARHLFVAIRLEQLALTAKRAAGAVARTRRT